MGLADFYADDVCGRGSLSLRRLRRWRGLRLIRRLVLRLRSESWIDGIVLFW